MTSRGRDSRSSRTDVDREDWPVRSGPRQPRRNLDAEFVALREQGRSYSAVAGALGIKRAFNAQEAFIRVMRSLPEKERRALQARESARLDQLEVRIRTRDADQPVKMERHLAGLEALRETMR